MEEIKVKITYYYLFQVEAGILTRTLYILSNADPTIEVALLNHKKLKIDELDDKDDEQNKSLELAKKSLHDLSQVTDQYLFNF